MKHVMKLAASLRLAVAVTCLVPLASRAEVRTWTDSSGEFRTQAELVDVRDGVVRLRKADGQIASIALERLSAADQEFVRKQTSGGPHGATSSALAAASAPPTALVELKTGAKVEGRLVARDDQSITLEVMAGGRGYTRKYPVDRISAVTVGGSREVLGAPQGGGSASPAAFDPAAAAPIGIERTPAEIDRLIDQLGRTPPGWWDSTPLSYPDTLDLTWPEPAPPPWNAQKNVGQYLWDVIYPNPARWREGIRFVHYLLDLHKNDRQKRARAMDTLGRMYYLLLQDYARAAFWWRQAGVGPGSESPAGVNLAECYWKLGSRQMALDLLDRIPVYYSTIKLLADMGETDQALRIADSAGRGPLADMAFIYAGDACRVAGRYDEAIRYYEKVLDVPATGQAKERIERNQQRARANIEGIRIFDTLDLARVPDGTYRASSPGYAGQVHVEVVVAGGRIASVKVVEHQEKQYYAALTETPRKILQKQSLKGIDATTSATITAEAIINATAKALAAGLK